MSCYRKDRRSWLKKHFADYGDYNNYICNLKHEKAFVEVFSSYKEPRRAEELRKMGYKKYVIKKGDTLIGICKKYYCDIDEIIRLNDIEDRNLIYAGDILYLDTIENVD